jgi:hypothetical protein
MKHSSRAVSAVEQAMLDEVTVRLIRPDEQARFNELIETQHYLHSAKWVGERLFYVAEYRGEWMALLSWCAPAYHLKARELWIGWNDRQRQSRLCLVANNTRFLILREAGECPNLASRVIRLCLDRLSDDWQHRYGHPIWIVETFVDPQMFQGTCYKVSGWEHLGKTAGWKRGGEDFYEAHDRPKQLWVRELRPGARTRLRGTNLPEAAAMVDASVRPYCEHSPEDLEGIRSLFDGVPDWRRGAVAFPLPGLLGLVACASLCGVVRGQRDLGAFGRTLSQKQLKALGFRKRGRGRNRRYAAPCETTYFNLLNTVDHLPLEDALLAWQTRRLGPRTAKDNLIACDGKRLKSSQGQESVSAYAVRSGRWLGSEPVEKGSNEIPAAQRLIQRLDLDGQRVSLDAMHTQTQTARLIVFDGGGDYLLTVKGNQSGIAKTLNKLRRGSARAVSPSASGESGGTDGMESLPHGSPQPGVL